MEDVIEELRENAEQVAIPLDLPNEDDLIEIEEQILLPIPYEFREFLLQVSDVVYGSMEPVTIADSHSHTYLPEVTATAWDLGVPRDLIPICEYNGDYYCVSAEGEVGLWSDGELQEEETWPTVWHWAKNVWLQS
ncbi:SMI1/KNR4 family protein [Endozoicomonas gorgoniicola]|uniref:SMI1/KNR4 family protein n=1 Tax=Endozoicomonas gorgoniicola TaxID=1234144 RepID=A0ABT3MPP9_9GAMM|nr:SMI1/KNR4 family protein [Endozoicomonas gorgoniicola]MCW7551350.1 SMI1/KNR4 family protein [Endozoicomonas gorgoniicola]